MNEIVFSVPGTPIGKARPRVVNNGGRSVAYTPQKTKDYENFMRMLYLQAAGNTKLDGAIKVDILAVFEIPKSYTKKRIEEIKACGMEYLHKPDCDNIAKVVLDSLNGVAWDDDAAVVEIHVKKMYGEKAQVIVGLSKKN